MLCTADTEPKKSREMVQKKKVEKTEKKSGVMIQLTGLPQVQTAPTTSQGEKNRRPVETLPLHSPFPG